MSEKEIGLHLNQIKGSWEERLSQAQQLMSDNDPAGLSQCETLVDRLIRLPVAQRAAAEQRLNRILIAALISQAQYHASDARYAAAYAALRHGVPHLPAAPANELEGLALEYLLSDGQVEEALAALEARARSGDLDDWGSAFFAAVRVRDTQRARVYIAQAERWVNHAHQQAFATPAARRDLGAVAYLKARHAVAQANGAEALAWYEHAMTLDEFYRDDPSHLYRHLVNIDAVAEALTLVHIDQQDPMRAGFWRGLLAFRQGQHDAARQHWQKASKVEPPDDGETSLLEAVLNHYYLGDEEGVGLSIALDVLNTQGAAWGPLFLAGVGWALRGELGTAQGDLHHARRIYRASGAGRVLPHDLWRFCTDLLDAPTCDALKEYFEDAAL